jgi:hypothetical protein
MILSTKQLTQIVSSTTIHSKQQQQQQQNTEPIGNKEDERCTCPDPAKPQARTEKEWKAHHEVMVKDAHQAPKDLDIVFLGDSIIERWNGTKSWGTHTIAGMRTVFEKRFTRAGGGSLEGIALGSSGDVVR